MTVEEKVLAILSAADALTAYVPADRIKVPGDWQALALPYIIHQPVAGRTNPTHGGLAELREWDFYEVKVYAERYSSARLIANLVIAAMDGYSDADVDRIGLASTPVPAAIFDGDKRFTRVNLDFEIAGALT